MEKIPVYIGQIALLLFVYVFLPYEIISLINIGEYGYAIVFIFITIGLITYHIYLERVIIPRELRMINLSLMYNIPIRVKSEDCQWGKVFHQIIEAAKKNVTEEDKKEDLQQCGRIVKKMNDEKSFDDLHRAFRLTGCQMKITDGNGTLITKVV